MSIMITTLIENTLGKNLSLYSEHGLSFFIEGENYNILYDTGQTNKFMHNAKLLGIDLSKVSHVVMSHGHYDHTGGFKDFVNHIDPSFDLYISKHFLNKKYAFSEGEYIYKGTNFDEFFLDHKGIRTQYIKNDIVEIAPNIILSTNFKRVTPYEKINPKFYVKQGENYIIDDFKDEVVLSIITNKGLIVLLGCAHPGVVNILETLMKRTGKSIYCIIGGTHLVEADEGQIKYTLDYFKEIDVKHIGVSHCTGEKVVKELERSFDCYFYNCTGTKIKIDSGFQII